MVRTYQAQAHVSTRLATIGLEERNAATYSVETIEPDVNKNVSRDRPLGMGSKFRAIAS